MVVGHVACSGAGATSTPVSEDAGSADGSTGNGDDGGSPDATTGGGPASYGVSVLMRNKNPSRDGLYIDPLLTRAAVKSMHPDPGFTTPSIPGPVYAQLLYVENGANGKETIFAATQQNAVYAIDAVTGGILWQKSLGPTVPQASFNPNFCSNIDPIGVTGTPAIDLDSRSLFLDSLTTHDGGLTKIHLIYSLSLDDGSVRHNYPIDVAAKLAAKGVTFDPGTHQQRGALILVQHRLYVPYGGFAGDCGDYHGTVLGIPIENPNQVYYWRTTTAGGGIWGVGGPSSDGDTLYVATGNATDTNAPAWGGDDAVVRLGAGPTFSGQTTDYFAPSNWRDLDAQDLELGGTQPILIDLPGAAHPKLAIAMSKAGNIHVLDRTNLGGLGKGDGTSGEGLASAHVASDYIINAPTAYTTQDGTTYVALKGPGVACPTGSTLLAVKITGDAQPAIATGWCAAADFNGSPISSTTDGHAESIVWTLGAEGDGKINAYHGETGELLFAGGPDAMPQASRYQSPIIVKGRVLWASNEGVHAFTVR